MSRYFFFVSFSDAEMSRDFVCPSVFAIHKRNLRRWGARGWTNADFILWRADEQLTCNTCHERFIAGPNEQVAMQRATAELSETACLVLLLPLKGEAYELLASYTSTTNCHSRVPYKISVGDSVANRERSSAEPRNFSREELTRFSNGVWQSCERPWVLWVWWQRSDILADGYQLVSKLHDDVTLIFRNVVDANDLQCKISAAHVFNT